MSETAESLWGALSARFGVAITGHNLCCGELTIEVDAAVALDVFVALRDESGFEELIDVAGVDYSAYGLTEWATDDTSSRGFSRGFVARAPGRSAAAVNDALADAPLERRFAAVYQLLSVSRNERLRVRVFAPDDELPVVPSVINVWASASWYEREAFDMYGIVFEGHPDLRRLLTDYGFVGHPFRKDFPLIGNVEMRYDPERARVVYEPVSIDPRVLVPRVIREDHRYVSES